MEIARRLNISHTTVSRVLNNRSNVFVSEDTRNRVLRAAREMGYRPNLAARSLREARTNVVAVFGSSVPGLAGGITPEIVRGLTAVLHTRSYGLFFALSEPSYEADRVLSSWRFDGAIVLQAPTPSTLKRLSRGEEPFVCVNEWVEGSHAVLSAEAEGTRLALDHLWAFGHRSIAYLTASTWHLPHYSVGERHETYLAFLRERGAHPVPGHEVTMPDGPLDEYVDAAVVRHGATAILAYDHVIATRVVAAASKLGLRIPGDFSLLSFNDEFPVTQTYPPLSVVAVDGEEMGRQGGGLLLDQLESPCKEPVSVRVPPRLVERESVMPPSSR